MIDLIIDLIIGLMLIAMVITAAYGYPIRKPHDPMADVHGDVPHVGPWVKRRPF